MPTVQTLDVSPTAGDASWPKLKLSPMHQKLWEETRTAMLWAVPHFSDIWLAMMADRDGTVAWFTDKIPTAATDDKILYLNPTWFFALPLKQRVFVCTHEIMHAVFNHAGMAYMLYKLGEVRYLDGSKLPYDGDIMNQATDYVINDQLVVGKIGEKPEDGFHNPTVINGDMGVLDAYRVLYKKQKQDKKQGKPSTGNGGGQKGFDKLLKPGEGRGKEPNKAMAERSEAEWNATVTAAMESAKLRGQLPANLERLFVAKLSPKADWRDLYQLAVSRKMGNDRYTWGHLDPQLIYRRIGAPGRSTHGCNLVVIAVDTSGSINQHTLDVFLAETTGLLEQVRPKQVIFAQCDARIHEWSSCDAADELYGKKIKGGGGTSFMPVFERVQAEQLCPDVLCYLTDGEGTFPPKPNYPVVWGVIGNVTPPWGEVVRVPAQAQE